MEAADCLYGVSMAPGGSSRVVSERVSNDQAMMQDQSIKASTNT